MRILLTNIKLCDGSGTETLIRDLSLALRHRGHVVICFAPTIGRMAADDWSRSMTIRRGIPDRRYLHVRHVLRERLVSENAIAPERVIFWGNTIDLKRTRAEDVGGFEIALKAHL
jgi:hypothetical protein